MVAWTCDQALLEHMPVIEFPRGQVIYAEGDKGDCLYIVIAGKVKIRRRSADGREILLGLIGPSDVFGAVSMFDSGIRTADASAITDVRTMALDRMALRYLVTHNPEIAEVLLRVFSRRLRLTDNALATLISTDGPGRLAQQLLQLAQRFGKHEGDGLRVTHDLTQQEIAQLIGSSRETVNKALANFADRGWIRVDGRSVLIRQPERLARRAR